MCDDPHLPQVTGILGDIEIPPEEMSPRERTAVHTLIRSFLLLLTFRNHMILVVVVFCLVFFFFSFFFKLSKSLSPLHAVVEKKKKDPLRVICIVKNSKLPDEVPL